MATVTSAPWPPPSAPKPSRIAAQAVAVAATAGAVAQVPARAPAQAHAAVAGQREVGADVGARGVARLARLHEPDPRAHEQRLDGGHGDVQRAGQLGVAQPVELAHEQRRALLGGQPPHVGHQAAQLLATLGLVQRVAQRRARDVEQLARIRQRTAELVDAAVVRDAVQPGAQRDRPVVLAQRAVGPQEDVLQRVLGVRSRAGQHLPRVGEQALAIAIVYRAERVVVAEPEAGDQLLVRAQAQQRAGRRTAPAIRRSVKG